MGGAGVDVHGRGAVVGGAVVLVRDGETDGRAEREAVFGARLDGDEVFFVAGGGEGGLPGAAPGELRLDVGGGEGEGGGAVVDYAADRGAVGFAEAGRGGRGVSGCVGLGGRRWDGGGRYVVTRKTWPKVDMFFVGGGFV